MPKNCYLFVGQYELLLTYPYFWYKTNQFLLFHIGYKQTYYGEFAKLNIVFTK